MENPKSEEENWLIRAAKRLVVLVPDLDLDETSLGRQIWNLALTGQKSVVLLSATQNIDEDLRIIQRLTQIYAVANDPRFRLETIVKYQFNWVKAIKSVYKQGDLILCFETHMIPYRIFWRQPIKSAITNNLKIPVYVFPKSAEPALKNKSKRIPAQERNVI